MRNNEQIIKILQVQMSQIETYFQGVQQKRLKSELCFNSPLNQENVFLYLNETAPSNLHDVRVE
jgi:hypothetical protein